ncbi:MAG: hypothetical protein CMA77_02100 [Euryarchaeota archaeon]|nr:hypothetical protein [Euryarchaeota archaeon]
MSNNCKKCGFANESGSFFCESCGEKMPDVDTTNTSGRSPFARPLVEKRDTDSTENSEKIVCTSCDNKNPSDSNFCEDCGAKLSGLEVPARLINNSNGEVMQILKEKNVFGRQDFVKWVPEEYDDPRISREHIRIDFDDGKYVLSLAKAQVNVTKLNGGPLAGEEVYDLKNKDEIDIAAGRIVLTFEVDSDSTASDKKTPEKKSKTKASKGKSGDGDKSASKK